MRRLQTFLTLALALLFIGADPPPLDPDIRAAAPEGWLVMGKSEAGYEWLRFSASADIEGEDFRDDSLTLTRAALREKPSKVGKKLLKGKLEEQKATGREKLELEIEGVKWKGIDADYLSEAGVPRKERYIYTDKYKKTLYIYWSRGPAANWEAGAALRETTLRKISAHIAGVDAAAAAEGGSH